MIRELPDATAVPARMLELHARDPGRYPVFLDSAATGGPLGRFSMLLAAPGERLSLDREGRLEGPAAGNRFCKRLNAWSRSERGPAPPGPWPRSEEHTSELQSQS